MSILKARLLSAICAVVLSTTAWAEDKPVLQVLEPPSKTPAVPVAPPVPPAAPELAQPVAPAAPAVTPPPATPSAQAAVPYSAPPAATPYYPPAPTTAPAPASQQPAAPSAPPAWQNFGYPGPGYYNPHQYLEDMRSARRWSQNPQAESRRQWLQAQREARRAYYQNRHRSGPWGGR